MTARLGRILLAVALVVAQQSALAHQIWHAAAGAVPASQSLSGEQQGGDPKKHRLCDLHTALGTVLGALSAAAAGANCAEVHQPPFAAAQRAVAEVLPPSPASRSPPLSL